MNELLTAVLTMLTFLNLYMFFVRTPKLRRKQWEVAKADLPALIRTAVDGAMATTVTKAETPEPTREELRRMRRAAGYRFEESFENIVFGQSTEKWSHGGSYNTDLRPTDRRS